MVEATMGGVSDAADSSSDSLFRRALLATFRRVVRVYFREIETAGTAPPASVGGRIFLSNHTNGLVDPILVLTAAECPISPVAKSTLWNIPGLKWLLDAADAVPIIRRKDNPNKVGAANEEIFDRIASALHAGKNILIFPEGTSHNEPKLIEVKTGAARMLARARERGARGLTFQSVALEFDARETFRSRCLIVYGPVREVDDVAATSDDVVAGITEQLRADLSELLVEGATWPERRLIARVAEMLANDSGDRTMQNWNAVGRQVEAARKALGEGGETVMPIEAAVDRYYALLAEEGLADEQLAEGGDPTAGAKIGPALLLALPLAIAGAALYAAPYQLTRLVAERVKEGDEVSTIKLGTGLVAYPLWALGLVSASFVFTPLPVALASSAVIVSSPFATLAWRDRVPQIRRALRFRSRASRLEELRTRRDEALTLIRAARDRLGLA